MKFENTEVFNFEGALRGMRNPKASWKKSDSFNCHEGMGDCKKCPFFIDGHQYSPNECQKEDELDEKNDVFIIGPNDLKLAQTLIRAGSEHRKFMRQIFVSVDISAPQYFWSEFDTYKVGTVANSTSKMHKLASTPITIDCFEHGEMIYQGTIAELEMNRLKYLETNDINIWKKLIVNLPESWLQKRTVTMNYENLLAICSKGQRRFHKLTEWSKSFIDWARTLPYAQELIFIDEQENKTFVDEQEDK